jgi:hypothetical protein
MFLAYHAVVTFVVYACLVYVFWCVGFFSLCCVWKKWQRTFEVAQKRWSESAKNRLLEMLRLLWIVTDNKHIILAFAYFFPPPAVWLASVRNDIFSQMDCCAFLRLIIVIAVIIRSRDSSVGIATGWTTRVQFPAMLDFLFSTASRLALGPTQPSCSVSTGGTFHGFRAAGAWSWPSSAEVKKGGAVSPLPRTSPWRGPT